MRRFMKYAKRVVGTLCFLLLFYWSFTGLSHLLMHKQIEGQWNMTAKIVGFYNEVPDSCDVMFFGSSHMYCSVDPLLVTKYTGRSAYVFATQKQPLWITYHYMIEALKTQNPEVMCVEIHMASISDLYMDEGTNHTAIDPIPYSLNKIEMIAAAAPEGKRRYYIFDVMKYHERWQEIEKADYTRKYETKTDPDKGYVRLTSAAIGVERADLAEAAGRARITEKNRLYINKIIDLAQRHGIRLILFKTPSNALVREEVCYNAVEEIAKERGVEFVNYNTPEAYERLGLDTETDFYDIHHLNESGMEKFVPDFCERVLAFEQSDNPVVTP